MMPAKHTPPPQPKKSVVALVKDAPKPTFVDRGKLLQIEDLQEILPKWRGKPRSRWWFNHSFLPTKKVMIGRSACWWEADVLAAIDRGELG